MLGGLNELVAIRHSELHQGLISKNYRSQPREGLWESAPSTPTSSELMRTQEPGEDQQGGREREKVRKVIKDSGPQGQCPGALWEGPPADRMLQRN